MENWNLEQKASKIDEIVTELTDRIDDLESEVAKLENERDTLAEEVLTLTSKLDDLESELTEYKNTFNP